MVAYREIELNVFSAEDLRDVRIFGGKMSPYLVAWIHHDMKVYSPVDMKGSTSPSWNAKMVVHGDEAALQHPDEAVVYFELHDAASVSNRLIGSLSLPLADLPGNIASLKEPSEPVFLNLPVKRPSGREQGVLNLSLKMGGVTHEPVLSDARHEEEAHFHGGAAAGMANESSLLPSPSSSPPSSFAATGCCAFPHFYRDDRVDGTNVFAH